MTLSLDFLPQTAYAFLLIFARVGSMAMALPGIGDRSVPSRLRLVFALALTVILYPVVHEAFPNMPDTIGGMLALLVGEVIVGLAIGLAVKMIATGLQVAGSTIAIQTGLGFAQNVDPAQGIQTTLFASFFSVLSVTLIFATDLHHYLLIAVHDSYRLFRPGMTLPSGDFAEVALTTLADSFRLAFQIAAPFLVFGLVFYLGVGVLSRLIPQVQVFFLAMPANILLGFILLLFLLSNMMLWFLDYYGKALEPYIAG